MSSGLSNCRPSHTWPMCWYVWLTNNKSKCQFYNMELQEGCDVHNRLWNSTVMCENLTAWTLCYPLPFGVKNSQFPSTVGYVNIFNTDNKILSSVTRHFRKTTKLHAVTSTTINPLSTYPIIWRKQSPNLQPGLCKLQYDPLLLKTECQDNFSEYWSVWCISTGTQAYTQDVLQFVLKKSGSKFSVTKMKTKWKTKQWLHIFELPISTLLLTATLSWKKRKENKLNDAHLWHTAINIHIDINTLAKANLANTQQVRITVILVQQKFTASFLSWTSTILFFLISHDLFHTPFKEVRREYIYQFPNPTFNLPKNRANLIFTVTESCSAESFHTKPQIILWFQQNLGKCCHTLETFYAKCQACVWNSYCHF